MEGGLHSGSWNRNQSVNVVWECEGPPLEPYSPEVWGEPKGPVFEEERLEDLLQCKGEVWGEPVGADIVVWGAGTVDCDLESSLHYLRN